MKTQVDNVWKVIRTTAQLSTNELEGTVNLTSPESGLHVHHAFGKPIEGSSILGFLHVPPVERINSDQYIRGDDLVATYRSGQAESQTAQDLMLTDQVYWRHFSLADPCNCCGTELVISLQTDRLDLQPRIKIHSRLAAAKVSLVKVGNGQPEIEPITDHLAVDPSGAVAILVQHEQNQWSYLQSLHFTDEHSCDQVEVNAGEGHVDIFVSLLVDHLEKGVIRRARLRGAFLNQADVNSDALSHWFTEFAESELPLTV